MKVLGSMRLTYLDYTSFDRAMSACAAVFEAWDDSLKEFTNVAREVTRKRAEKFIPIKINAAHVKLQERVIYLRQFRKQHNQLQVMVGPLGSRTRAVTDGRSEDKQAGFGEIDMDFEVRRRALSSASCLTAFPAQVRETYESIKNVDVLDVSQGMSWRSGSASCFR